MLLFLELFPHNVWSKCYSSLKSASERAPLKNLTSNLDKHVFVERWHSFKLLGRRGGGGVSQLMLEVMFHAWEMTEWSICEVILQRCAREQWTLYACAALLYVQFCCFVWSVTSFHLCFLPEVWTVTHMIRTFSLLDLSQQLSIHMNLFLLCCHKIKKVQKRPIVAPINYSLSLS